MEIYDNKILLEHLFAGSATKKELQYLLKQLDNGDFEQTWMKEQWEAASDKMNPSVQKLIYEKIREKTVRKRIFKMKQWTTIAASFLLVFSTSVLGYLYYESQSVNLAADTKVEVEKGQKANVTLPDGSRVWVNSGSTLTYGSRYNKKERIINLQGEAYFEVAKNKNAPFIVQSNGFSVKALGTAFDVKAYMEEKEISVVLIRGLVEVGDDLNKIRLVPNQKVIYNRLNRNLEKHNVDDGVAYANWRRDQLSFESETLENIALVLERNYNVKMVFESESLKKYHYSGVLGNNSLESILQIFSMTSPMTYQIKDSIIYLKENKTMTPYYKKMLK